MINKEKANKVEAMESDTIKTIEFAGIASLHMSSSISTPSCRFQRHYCHKCSMTQPRIPHRCPKSNISIWKITESLTYFMRKSSTNYCSREGFTIF